MSYLKTALQTSIINGINKIIRPAIRFAAETDRIPKYFSKTIKIPVDKTIMKKLKVYQIRQKEKFLAYKIRVDDDFLVFCTSIGTHMDQNNSNKRVKRIYAKCGIQDKRFYDLRHTYATRLFELGEAPKTVQMLMGHFDKSQHLFFCPGRSGVRIPQGTP